MKKIYNFLIDITDLKQKKGRIATWVILIGAILTLGLTSYYVAEKSAIVHNNNNDQLIDGFMFESPETFKEALFPAAHTFLLKWPIFAISAALGNSASVYIWTTIVVYFITIFGFLYIVYLITKRNVLVTALIALCLSSILLLVPPQPFNTNFLPVNMAMVTTRNIEFLILFLYIYLIIKTKKINSLPFYSSIIVLGILGASDKFFLMISLASTVLFAMYHLLFLKNKINISHIRPLLSALSGYVLATVALVTIDKSNITNIPSPTMAAPFALTSSVWQMLEALAGAVQGIVVNFGAGFFGRSASAQLLPYAVNGLILIASFYAIHILFLRKSIIPKTVQNKRWEFVLWLLLLLISAILIFIASNHGYLNDARYLSGALFAGIAALAYLASTYSSEKSRIVILGLLGLLVFTTPIAVFVAKSNLNVTIAANEKEIGIRTSAAATIIDKENADILVGDYWFVGPVKLKANKHITAVPMSTEMCDTSNYFLTSGEWYKPTNQINKSAYYILRDAQPDAETFNHGCTMDYLNQKYGVPEKEYIIRGTTDKPIDVIRIYAYDVRSRF